MNKNEINEVFDDILFGEELAEKSGFNEGFNAGKCQSIKGYHLGYHRASELSAKLGFYTIIIQHCLDKNIYSSKINQQAIKLNNEINNFPQHNDESIDIIQLSENIKFKFIRLCSLAKIDSSYPESDKLNF